MNKWKKEFYFLYNKAKKALTHLCKNRITLYVFHHLFNKYLLSLLDARCYDLVYGSTLLAGIKSSRVYSDTDFPSFHSKNVWGAMAQGKAKEQAHHIHMVV